VCTSGIHTSSRRSRAGCAAHGLLALIATTGAPTGTSGARLTDVRVRDGRKSEPKSLVTGSSVNFFAPLFLALRALSGQPLRFAADRRQASQRVHIAATRARHVDKFRDRPAPEWRQSGRSAAYRIAYAITLGLAPATTSKDSRGCTTRTRESPRLRLGRATWLGSYIHKELHRMIAEAQYGCSDPSAHPMAKARRRDRANPASIATPVGDNQKARAVEPRV